MANIAVNPNPRTKFQGNATHLQAHRELLMSEPLDRAIAAAMLQYQTELAQKCNDQYSAMSMGLRLLGAHEFVTKLWELGVIPERFKPVLSDNLDHHV